MPKKLTKKILTVQDDPNLATDQMVIRFWGVRGTLPVPGKDTVRYGGNTNCVTLSCSSDYLFIFDGGTGIKALSNYLHQEYQKPLKAKIFISHPHWDHINGLPFFAPFYKAGNEFEILGMGHAGATIEQLISNQMDSIYFPVTIEEFSAEVRFRNLSVEHFYLNDVDVQTIKLNHPGECLGYRIQYQHKIFCYITDNELYLENDPRYQPTEIERLINFIYAADVLVIDATYTDEEYLKKINWGHSCISRVIDLADKAKVKLLCLYHHDPDQIDADIDLKLNYAKSLLKLRRSKTRCIAPHEGSMLII